MAGNNIRATASVNDKASKELDRIRDKFTKLQKQGAKGVGVGIGAGLAVGAIGAATAALSSLGQVMGDATEAAIAEEESIARLTTSLKANVPAWNGNTDAIERTLKARMDLGFSDDEQRDSLAKIVVATKDVTKALEVQRAAMDLARLKNISLADASSALIKVEAGQFRALKALGIELKAGATATEALAAVTKAAAGQAEAYAETSRGKMLAAQVRVGEAMEVFGEKTLPAVVAATEAAADAVSIFALGLDVLSGKGAENADQAEATADSFIGFAESVGAFIPIVGAAGKALEDAKDSSGALASSMERHAGKIDDDFVGPVSDGFSAVEEAADDAADATIVTWEDVAKSLGETASSMIDDFFDPIETRADLYQERLAQNAAEEAFRDADTVRGKKEAEAEILESIRNQADGLVDLSKRQALTKKDVDTFEKNVEQSYKALGKKVPKEVRAIIATIKELDQWDGHTINVGVKLNKAGNQVVKGKERRAKGGPVQPNEAYTVGEEGPETLVMGNQGGTIIPNGKGTGGDTFHITFTGPIGGDQNNLVRQVHRLRRVAHGKQAMAV